MIISLAKVVAPLLGALALIGVTSKDGMTGDYTRPAQTVAGPNRCETYGPAFAAIPGTGDCVRIGGHVRVQPSANVGLNSGSGWTTGKASSAALRSDNTDMTPTGTTSHLRVRGGLEYPDPFR